jgi:monoamine oxidase
MTSTTSSLNKYDGETVDVCIVGAGLSGAYAAYLLRGYSVAVVDSRCRVGGRLLTAEEQGGGDLGGSWIWPRSECVMKQFVDELGIKTVDQYADGESFFRTSDGRSHSFPPGEADRYVACGGGAVRVSGGAAKMVQTLLKNDTNVNLSIYLGMKVVRVEYGGDVMRVINVKAEDTNNEVSIRCRAAILAAPPKVLANSICFDPPLPKIKIDSMLATPTWMEDYGKVAVSFPHNWWRRLNLSAVSIDRKGFVSTWWEACSGIDGDGSCPTIAGFVTAFEAKKLQKLESAEALHDHVIDSLTNIYPVDAVKMGMQIDMAEVKINGSAERDGITVVKGGITVVYKSWLKDRHTNVPTSSDGGFACDYGDVNLRKSVGSLFFAGTETSHGSGHMEGAIISAQRAADEVKQYLMLDRT